MTSNTSLLDIDRGILERNLLLTESTEDELHSLFPVTSSDQDESRLVKPSPVSTGVMTDKENTKSLNELGLSELQTELKSRRINAIGPKCVLVKRLETDLIDSGLDPDKCKFVVDNDEFDDAGILLDENIDSEDCGAFKVIDEILSEVAPFIADDKPTDELQTPIEDFNKIDQIIESTETENRVAQSDSDVKAKKEPISGPPGLDFALDLRLANEEENLLSCGENRADTVKDENVITSDCFPNSSEVKYKMKNETIEDSEKDNDIKIKLEQGQEMAKGSRNLWISGLSMNTKAGDLKVLLSKVGRVVCAKVVANSCAAMVKFGYVTMFSEADANKCIESLNRTELHGSLITISKIVPKMERSAKEKKVPTTELSVEEKPIIKTEPITPKSVISDKKVIEKDVNMNKIIKNEIVEKKESSLNLKIKKEYVSPDQKENKGNCKSSEPLRKNVKTELRSKSLDKNRRVKKDDKKRPSSKDQTDTKRRAPDVLTYSTIKNTHENEKKRKQRELDRLRRERVEKELRNLRTEKMRLERERQAIERERTRLHDEQREYLRLLHEKDKLEREKLHQDLDELRRAIKKTSPNRCYSNDSLKRPSSRRCSSNTPPPSRRHTDVHSVVTIPMRTGKEYDTKVAPSSKTNEPNISRNDKRQHEYLKSRDEYGKVRKSPPTREEFLKPRVIYKQKDADKKSSYSTKDDVVASRGRSLDAASESSRSSSAHYVDRGRESFVSSHQMSRVQQEPSRYSYPERRSIDAASRRYEDTSKYEERRSDRLLPPGYSDSPRPLMSLSSTEPSSRYHPYHGRTPQWQPCDAAVPWTKSDLPKAPMTPSSALWTTPNRYYDAVSSPRKSTSFNNARLG